MSKFFHSQIFERWKYILISTYTNISEQLSILLNLYYFFVKISTHYKNSSNCIVVMPLKQKIWLKYLYIHVKFYCPNLRRSWFLLAKTVWSHLMKVGRYTECICNSSKLTTFSRLKRFFWMNLWIKCMKINLIMLIF